MKFKLNYFIFSSLLLLLCSFIKLKDQNIRNNKTEFSETCLKISNEYKTQNEHGTILNNKTKKFISLTEFSKTLKDVAKFDLDKKTKYKVEESNIGKIERIVWKNTTKKSNLISFERLTFKTIIEQEFSGGKFRNEFKIVDYLITRNKTPKKIYLRIMENEFDEITIDDIKYTGVFESRLLGIDEAMEEFDKLLNKK